VHFRVRKNVIQLVRIVYDESKKKGVTSVVGTVRLEKPELSPELRQALTQEEIASFDTWVKAQHRTEMLREELAALTLPEAMARAQRWFEREQDSAAARALAPDIVAHWQALRRVLVKKGFLD
jgi:hypothetical protein